MQAIAIVPGRPGSLHLREVARPALDDLPGGTAVRVAMVRIGLCGTDVDLAAGHYGSAPAGEDHLVLGHESSGRVLEVGPAVGDRVRVGGLVVVAIRRPGSSAHDRIGRPDLSSDAVFTETGISGAHGFLTEEVVADVRDLISVPDELEPVAVLAEPLSCVTKALRQADQVQARLELWQPRRALVVGSSTIGLLATLALRLRGLGVTVVGRRSGHRNVRLLERIGAHYVSAKEVALSDVADHAGPFDIVFEGSGDAAVLPAAVAALAPNGVLALFSVTPTPRPAEVDLARLNQAIVLYDRVIVGSAAAAWYDYAGAIETMARAEADPSLRGWLSELITERIVGLDVAAISERLSGRHDGIKSVVELGPSSR